MKRKQFDYILKKNNYLEGGTKEACIKIREFLRNAMRSGNQINSSRSCVTADEFVGAVKTLMAFTFQQEDIIPERWYCDFDCDMNVDFLCPGEFNITENTNKLCPFFHDDMSHL